MSEEQIPEAPVFGWKKTLLFSMLPMVVLFSVLEGGARIAEIWIPPRQVDPGQGFNPESRLFVPSTLREGWLKTNPSKLTSFRKERFPEEKEAGELRIFMLGGSSVQYLWYWIPILQDRLAEALGSYETVRIVNCGGLSYGSHRLVPIAAEVLQYNPDLILIYSGHNEFEELEQLKLAQLKTLPLQRILSKSALIRFLRDRLAGYRISQLEDAYNRRILADSIPDSSRAWAHPFSKEEIESRMANYRNNLALIIQMCQEAGVKVVIGTVPSNLMKPSLPGKEGDYYSKVFEHFEKGDWEKGKALAQRIFLHAARHQSSDSENSIIRSLAKHYDIPLADVEKAVTDAEPHSVPGETLFSDHCHLNDEGNRILTETFEAEILDLYH